jgi:hypothetical protein
VRYYLSGREPASGPVLLVESGSRAVLDRLIPVLRRAWGDDTGLDVVTCFANAPEGLAAASRVYHVSEYRGPESRGELYRLLAARHYSRIGIVCSGEVLMAKWKWMLAARLPAKVFIINENSDFFWLDRRNLATLRQFVLLRSGLAGAGAVRILAGVVTFPFILCYLLLYAGAVNARRAVRGG